MDFIKKLTTTKKEKSPSKQSSPQKSHSQSPRHHYAPNPDAPKPKGILKNAKDAKKYSNANALPPSNNIDESLRNAQKNSSLNQSLTHSLSQSPKNEEMKTQNNEKKKGLKWNEQNLSKNEEEKVPRMKIDEPPTPYAEMPEELKNNLDSHDDAEEIILDFDPNENEMSLDENHKPDIESKQTLDQQQQSLLLGDDEYRQKMVNDALERRTENEKNKVALSAWEVDDHSSDNMNGAELVKKDDKAAKKAKFASKRKAHYNEFHAVKAWKAKNSENNSEDFE